MQGGGSRLSRLRQLRRRLSESDSEAERACDPFPREDAAERRLSHRIDLSALIAKQHDSKHRYHSWVQTTLAGYILHVVKRCFIELHAHAKDST